MGNCMCPASIQSQDEVGVDHKKQEAGEKGSLRVKIVLTRQELEWLMHQLKVSNGGKKLEDVLGEIERGRSGECKAWKPSLDSIMETSEGLELDSGS